MSTNELQKMEAAFEIEELEDRLEFAEWFAKAGYEENGRGIYGEVGVTF